MTENDRVPDAAADHVHVDQARAWLGVLDPLAAERWDTVREITDLTDDETRYSELGRGIVDDWHAHRDDPLDPGTRRVAEHEQSVAWLGEHTGSWRRAHALALERDEFDADFQMLLSHWHEHRDETTVPDALVQSIEALREDREGRVSAAKEWFRRHNPRYLSEWQTCRGFADSLEGEWNDDRHLVSRHLAGLKAAVSTREPPGQAQKNGAPESASEKPRGRLTAWMMPWGNRSQPRSGRDPFSL
ncbi:hypothetical protein [Glutamicibacter arilaitensis]|uniref:hypothetical protein n=1 Tax=Glutamicibacter arilaitensis TaxID=256701 RepID=UPI003FD46446